MLDVNAFSIAFLGSMALSLGIGLLFSFPNPIHQCCPAFLCPRAQFTDAYEGAGATTLLLLLLLLLPPPPPFNTYYFYYYHHNHLIRTTTTTTITTTTATPTTTNNNNTKNKNNNNNNNKIIRNKNGVVSMGEKIGIHF
jgi:hypothetical protein